MQPSAASERPATGRSANKRNFATWYALGGASLGVVLVAVGLFVARRIHDADSPRATNNDALQALERGADGAEGSLLGGIARFESAPPELAAREPEPAAAYSPPGSSVDAGPVGYRLLIVEAPAAPGPVASEQAALTPPVTTSTAQAGGLDAGVPAVAGRDAQEALLSLPQAVRDRGFTYCGAITCGVGQRCCCDQCISHDEQCEPSWCASEPLPISVPCGLNLCSAGQVCCNASCGICVTAGETCSQRVCD